MKKKILIIGSTGMLGSAVLNEFTTHSDFEIFATYRNKKDVELLKKKFNHKFLNVNWYKFDIKKNYQQRLKKICKRKDYIINCVGVIKPYINEEDVESIENALKINSIFPHTLNKITHGSKTKILQIATDCVYDGIDGNYNENISHNASDIYGKSKSIGEVKFKNFFNIRCSIIGEEIKSFKSLINWFLSNPENSKLNGFTNHMWNGVTTNFFAQFILVIIKKNIKIPNLLHLTPSNILSKFKLLKIFQYKFKREDLKISKSKSKISVNRVLKTNQKKVIYKICKLMGYKKVPTVEEIVLKTL
jgi:dTDP-4-dehydrorhamnose reductase